MKGKPNYNQTQNLLTKHKIPEEKKKKKLTLAIVRFSITICQTCKEHLENDIWATN